MVTGLLVDARLRHFDHWMRRRLWLMRSYNPQLRICYGPYAICVLLTRGFKYTIQVLRLQRS